MRAITQTGNEEAKAIAWISLKVGLIARFRTLDVAALALGCSRRGLRCAAEGTCPGILKRIHAAGILAEQISPKNLQSK